MPILQNLALEIFQLSVASNIIIEPEWIPREYNEVADYISKTVDYDDWMLHPAIFAQLDSLWGPHSIDRFANPHNRQVERFNSRFWVPETEAVDTFAVDWGSENNRWCPPVGLIPKLIQHVRKTKVRGTLIVSCWLSALFWPLLFPEDGLSAEFVQEFTQLPSYDWLLLPGFTGRTLFNGPPNAALVALRLNF